MSPLDPTPVPAELRGRRIAVLVSGGIAAYKVADLVSALTQAGAQVRVGMTPSARRFVGAATFHAVSGNPVLTSLWAADGAPEPHVELGDWAQLILVAPATANIVAMIASGESSDLVTATLLAARCPVVVAPAMNDSMWAKAAVAQNLARLHDRGIHVVEPEAGRLASGHEGKGRLAGAAALLETLALVFREGHDLAGRRVVVTAGGTREPIDPVRYISNYSSGKMGFAIAAAAAERGAEVVLVSAAGDPQQPGVQVRPVETAADLKAALEAEIAAADLLVMAAAVADFRPAATSEHKIRREETGKLVLELEATDDIVAGLARRPDAARVFKVGFAAETDDLEAKAAEKLERKGLDAIVANDVSRKDIAFGSDYNEAVVIFRDGTRVHFDRMPKRRLADKLLDLLRDRLPPPA